MFLSHKFILATAVKLVPKNGLQRVRDVPPSRCSKWKDWRILHEGMFAGPVAHYPFRTPAYFAGSRRFISIHRGLELNADLYGAGVRACARNGDAWRALFLLNEASKRGSALLPIDIAGTMRIVTKQAVGWKQALALYEGFLELTLEEARRASEKGNADGASSSPDDTINDAAGPLLGHGRNLHLLSEIAPGWEAVCQAALEACTSGGQWEKALDILGVLRAGGGGIELSKAAYDEAVQVCGNGRAWDMVLLLVAELSSDEVPISPSTFETALKASFLLL